MRYKISLSFILLCIIFIQKSITDYEKIETLELRVNKLNFQNDSIIKIIKIKDGNY